MRKSPPTNRAALFCSSLRFLCVLCASALKTKRVCFLLCLTIPLALAAQPAVKRIPADGIPVPAADRAELETGLAHLQASIANLKPGPLLPDVLIYSEAVRFSLQYNEFFKPAEIAAAKVLLQQGEERAAQLAAGQAPWTTATGLVVRGYVSKIDKSVQPYGLVVPPSYSPTAPHRWRLDTWFHGRDEALTQVNFLTARQKSAGEFTPRDTIVLHLYGRYCNASKFAGEVDLFEALDAVKRNYPIDENRILVRGFSMGGASVWHFAAHYPGLWAAASPGAGFAESAQFLKIKTDRRCRPALVGAEALALLRRHRLRRQSLQPAHRRIPRRNRPAAAGRRHDGARHGRGRYPPGPRGRPADRAQVPSRFQNPGGTDAR